MPDYTVVQPLKKLPRNNIILWTIVNGFNLFSYADGIIISLNDAVVTDKMKTVVQFVSGSEKMSNIGAVSMIGRRDYGEILYVQTDYIDYNCFMVSRNLGMHIKEKYANLALGEEISSLDYMFKGFNHFELSILKDEQK